MDVAEVDASLDALTDRGATPYELYLRWERQHWAVQDLDFSEDAAHWQRIEPGIREELFRLFCLFFMGEQLVADTLAPFVLAAPSEQERLFLTTQLVDEARHAVFFTRFFHEVLGGPQGRAEALAFAHLDDAAGFDRIFREDLTGIADHLRREPGDRVAYVRGITLYHFIVEGMLALTGQRFLLQVFREVGLMPGFTAGFTALARDESRHVSFGVWTLRRASSDPALREVIVAAARRWAPAAAGIIAAPDRPMGYDPQKVIPPFRVDPRRVREFSVASLGKWLRAAGVPGAEVDALEARVRATYEACTRRYEGRFGAHPIRWFEAREGAGVSYPAEISPQET